MRFVCLLGSPECGIATPLGWISPKSGRQGLLGYPGLPGVTLLPLLLLLPCAGSSKFLTIQRLCASRSGELPRRASTPWAEVSPADREGVRQLRGSHRERWRPQQDGKRRAHFRRGAFSLSSSSWPGRNDFLKEARNGNFGHISVVRSSPRANSQRAPPAPCMLLRGSSLQRQDTKV